MICIASSKHRSIRFARMWNSKSPGVETAWRAPARISRNTCSSAGRGGPKSRSHASDPKPTTQERPPSRSRNSTARNSAARSPQNDRRVARLSKPGFTVATRKIAARVSGAATGCGNGRTHRIGLHLDVIIWTSCWQGVTEIPFKADIRQSSTCRTDRAALRSRMGRQEA